MLGLAVKNVTREFSRSVLATLGISVGIAFIIIMVSVSRGMEQNVASAVGKMQGITVIKKGSIPPIARLDYDYVSLLEKMPGIKVAIPNVLVVPGLIDDKSSHEFSDIEHYQAVGMDIERVLESHGEGMYSARIVDGRFLKSNSEQSVALGKTIAEDFDKKVGGKIKVNSITFTIVGIFSSGGQMVDNTIVMPLKYAQELRGFSSSTISMIIVDPDNPLIATKLAKTIEARFPELKAYSGEEFAKESATMLSTIQAFTWVISAIAALVGGIGVANTMLMSVIEKTKEFGVLKAVGWKSTDVMKLVFYESLVVTLFGAFFGIMIGIFAVYFVIPFFITLPKLVDLTLILQASAFSLVLGFIGALYPVHMVSSMSPLEAFRQD